MGCNCGKKNGQPSAFVYTDPKGVTKTYKSEVEARAAQIRNGGGTYQAVR
jgi:hypothetical protein